MDILTKEERSKRMKSIKSKGTKEEVLLGKAMWNNGLRYLKNDKSVFGKPDFTLKRYKIAIFVDSEFFHGKNWETEKLRFKSNIEFWHKKIERNIERDIEVNEYLAENGWKILRFWSSEVKKNIENCLQVILTEIRNRTEQSIVAKSTF